MDVRAVRGRGDQDELVVYDLAGFRALWEYYAGNDFLIDND